MAGGVSLPEKRQLVRDLLVAALLELAPARLIGSQIRKDGTDLVVAGRRWSLRRPVLVLAYGKAAVPMARAMEPLLRGAENKLVIAAPEAFLAPGQLAAPWAEIEQFIGGHPEPNAASVAAARAMLAASASAPAGSLILHLISGGGSALAEAPLIRELELGDLQSAYAALVRNGAPIGEINIVRKHLSAVKGGRLAAAAPATAEQLSLILSDVPQGELGSVASGPSFPDSSSIADCARILAEHPTDLPVHVAARLQSGKLAETPKPSEGTFGRSAWHVLMDDRGAAAAVAQGARAAGLAAEIDHGADEWEYAAAAAYLLGRIRELKRQNPRACLIASGEVRVAVRGSVGRGGRNQTFAAECARRIAGEDLCVLSVGTDGIDGNSPAAGAVVDGSTAARAAALHFDLDRALANFDTYPLLAAVGDSVEIGPTGTNLRDLRILF